MGRKTQIHTIGARRAGDGQPKARRCWLGLLVQALDKETVAASRSSASPRTSSVLDLRRYSLVNPASHEPSSSPQSMKEK
jgi:hypothetical protein